MSHATAGASLQRSVNGMTKAAPAAAAKCAIGKPSIPATRPHKVIRIPRVHQCFALLTESVNAVLELHARVDA